jgi:hypothetical protein
MGNFFDDELASSEDISNFVNNINNLLAKKNLEYNLNCSDREKSKQEIYKNEIIAAKKRRHGYRQSGIVCCQEIGIAGPMKREDCIKNGYNYCEY